MLRFSDISLRWKIPLRVTALAVGTAVLVTASLIVREKEELERDLVAHSGSVGRVLANTLVGPLTHDDVWRAFEIINSPFEDRPRGQADTNAEIIMVLDPQHRVYVTTRPAEYPMLSNPGEHDPEYARVVESLDAATGNEALVIDLPDTARLYLAIPVEADGVRLGSLVLGHSRAVFGARFDELMRRSALTMLAALAILLPVSWLWARRIAAPLVQLASAMESAAAGLPDLRTLGVRTGGDEVGQLGSSFRRMVEELKEKEGLERQMVVADRLAALGRLSAGIAHEINNPLGGMLNAVSTYRRHGGGEAQAQKTLSLLERGLMQIKQTVGALLVEARVESHAVGPQDIDDIRTLVLPDCHEKGVELIWDNDLRTAVPLPSTHVRQILMNLALNAVEAVDQGGHVYCRAYLAAGSLYLLVKNDGRHIPEEAIPYLFEPFSRLSEKGHGLGLWVIYQIAEQLRGGVSVTSQPGETRFVVELPLPAGADAGAGANRGGAEALPR